MSNDSPFGDTPELSSEPIRIRRSEKDYFSQFPVVVSSSIKYKSLPPLAKLLMRTMSDKQRTSDQNGTGFSKKNLIDDTGMSANSIAENLKRLIAVKFIVMTKNYHNQRGLSRRYELTWCSYNGKKPTDKWRY